MSKLNILRCITPLHAGSGQDGGMIDLSIQREATTNFPKIESSSFKGALKHFAEYNNLNIKTFLGTKKDPSKIMITDSKLLFFPIKTAKNIFALVTCPLILNRLYEECTYYFNDEEMKKLEQLSKFNNELKYINNNRCYVISNSMVMGKLKDKIILDKYQFKTIELSGASDNNENILKTNLLAFDFPEELIDRTVIIDDDYFKYIIESNLEIATRIEINNTTGTNKGKSLFTEENLPAESILYNFIMDTPYIKNKNTEIELPKTFQIGGDASIGKGFVRCYGNSREEE